MPAQNGTSSQNTSSDMMEMWRTWLNETERQLNGFFGEVLGKPALSDLKEGKLTLPLILTMPRATARERELISRVVTSKSFDGVVPAEVIEIVRKYGAIEESRKIARDYAARARASLEPFPDSPAREALDLALDFVLDRDR